MPEQESPSLLHAAMAGVSDNDAERMGRDMFDAHQQAYAIVHGQHQATPRTWESLDDNQRRVYTLAGVYLYKRPRRHV